MADVAFLAGTGKIKREEFKLFANVGTDELPEWELQGSRVEDLTLEMNPNVETVTDITGVTDTVLDKYEKQTSVEPYLAKRSSKLAAWLYNVVREEKTGSDVEKSFLVVNVFAGEGKNFDAWIQKSVVAVQSYGGDTKGLQIPYSLHWIGEKTFGTATIDGGKVTFSPAVPGVPGA